MSSVERPNLGVSKPVRVRPIIHQHQADFAEPHALSDEEWANGLTHAIGCVLSLIGAVALISSVYGRGTSWHLLGCLLYATSLTAVYAASTLSHWTIEPQRQRYYRMWDQGLIYLLIAGSYTPFAIAHLSGWWHAVTIAMWSLALWGFLSKVAFQHRVYGVSLTLYLAMGWLPIVVLPELLSVMPTMAVGLILAGGIAYTLGSTLLVNDHRAPYLHTGWHLFVMLGSALHFYAVWQYTVPSV